MTITTILLSGAAVLALGVAARFLALREVEVRRSMIIDTTPAEVLAFAASTEVHQTCNPYRNENPDLVVTPFGPQGVVGAGFAFGTAGTLSSTCQNWTLHPTGSGNARKLTAARWKSAPQPCESDRRADHFGTDGRGRPRGSTVGCWLFSATARATSWRSAWLGLNARSVMRASLSTFRARRNGLPV